MAKMQAAIGETSAAASGRMISLEEVRKTTRYKKELKVGHLPISSDIR